MVIEQNDIQLEIGNKTLLVMSYSALILFYSTVGVKVEVHALQKTMLSNKAEQGLAGTIKQHLSTVVSQCHMLQNKVGCTCLWTI